MSQARTISRRGFLRNAAFAATAVAAGPLLQACSRDSNQLRFLNWQDYIAPDTLAEFQSRYNVSVAYQTYASNDELQRLLLLANSSRRRGRESQTFDLIVPSDNFVVRFKGQDLLQRLDHSKVPNLANLRPEFRQAGFDPGNAYTVPWATGSTGIGYDGTVFAQPPDWTVFLDTTYQGRMSILAEVRDAFAAALFSLGKDPNTTSAADVSAAADRLIEMKRVIAGFNSTSYLDDLATGKLVAAQAYSSDLLEARQSNANLDFVIPDAGGGRWVDSLAIPVNAPNRPNALTFINWYLDPSISAQVANFVRADTGNQAAQALLSPEVRNDPIAFPPPDLVSRLVFTRDLGEAEKLYAEGWARVQSA